jgi:hypothetical protein
MVLSTIVHLLWVSYLDRMTSISIPLSPPLSESLDKRVPLEASKWNLREIPLHNPLQKVEIGLAG